MLKRPKVSTLLSQLASYEAVQAAPTQVDQEGKTALKRKQARYIFFTFSHFIIIRIDFRSFSKNFRFRASDNLALCFFTGKYHFYPNDF